MRNIQSQPQVKVRIGDTEFNAIARVVHSDREPQLGATVKALFDTKYGWSDGLIAELTPSKRRPLLGRRLQKIAGMADHTRP